MAVARAQRQTFHAHFLAEANTSLHIQLWTARNKPITIVGGGLAGLTLGIGLRQRGVPVTLWEAGHYPRHRVCGEFISGRGQAALTRLGLARKNAASGRNFRANHGFFSITALASRFANFPSRQWSISRFALDEFAGAGIQANWAANCARASAGAALNYSKASFAPAAAARNRLSVIGDGLA